METRFCKYCFTEKVISCFRKIVEKKGIRYLHQCKDCERKKQNEYKSRIINDPLRHEKISEEGKTKKCTKCMIEKPLHDFRRVVSTLDGHNTQCKECEKTYHKNHRNISKSRISEILNSESCLTKKCKKCGMEKSMSDFHINPELLDGHVNTCKTCFRKRSDEYLKNHKERLEKYYRDYRKDPNNKEKRFKYMEVYEKEYRTKNREKINKKAIEYSRNHPDQRRAGNKLRIAVFKGKVKRKECKFKHLGNCHGNIQSHHEDYSPGKELEVIDMCARHHVRYQRGLPLGPTTLQSSSDTKENDHGSDSRE